jgi:hypothetical protein
MRSCGRSLLGLAIALTTLSLAGAAGAGVAPEARCKDAKGRATGKKSLDLLKGFGKNGKVPNLGKLGTDISKAESRFTPKPRRQAAVRPPATPTRSRSRLRHSSQTSWPICPAAAAPR